MKNSLNLFLLPNRFARFQLQYQHMPLSILKKVSSNAKNYTPVITMKLLQDFLTSMLSIAVESNTYTNTQILTFNKLQLPETIKIGYLLVRVDQYLSAPLRCTKCQKFDHRATKCRNPKYTCWRCINIMILITATQKILQNMYQLSMESSIVLQKMSCFRSRKRNPPQIHSQPCWRSTQTYQT